MSTAPYLCAGALFLLGLYGIITSRDYVHLIGCLSVLQSSTYVLLLSVGFRTGANAPIFNWPSVVLASVSSLRSASQARPSRATAVRQQPFTAMLAPSSAWCRRWC